MAVQHELWGSETSKAVENFPVSGERVPVPVVRWLGRIKAAAARVNAELGLLDADVAERIARAGDEVAAGEHDDQFPIDVFQTGSGTSSNMNANEVIANLAGDEAHPNDHVNMGQSSNDVFPCAVHLAAVDSVAERPAPCARAPRGLVRAQGGRVRGPGQGRPHAHDGRGARDARPGVRRLRRADLARAATACAARSAAPAEIPLGGTATGTGLNTHPEFAERVRERLGVGEAPRDRFEAQANRDALVELHGALKVVAVSLTKIANDLVLMGSGPRTGLVELQLPELQKGSSIMPGKVNPVIPEVVLQVAAQVIGNDTAITVAGTQGAFELNVRVPMIARNLFESIRILTSACHMLAEQLRGRHRGQRGDAAAPRRVDPRDRDRAQPAHRLRPRHRDREGGVASERTIREVAIEKGVDEETLDERSTCARWRAGRRPSRALAGQRAARQPGRSRR